METYLVVGGNLNLNIIDCHNVILYFKAKFDRYMHSLAKPSQGATSQKFIFVTLQDLPMNFI